MALALDLAQALALEVGVAAEVQELGASNNPCDGGIRPRLGSGLGLGYPRSLMRSAPKQNGVGVGLGDGVGVGVGVGAGVVLVLVLVLLSYSKLAHH